MRRLLVAFSLSTAIAVPLAAIPSTAGARYIGTFFTYPYQQTMSGPEYISYEVGMDANVACSWMVGRAPENNPWFNPCAYSGAQHGVCVGYMNIYGQQAPWKCGWEAAGRPVNNYGYVTVWSWLPYSGVALFTLSYN
jgi:hypothetical protein